MQGTEIQAEAKDYLNIWDSTSTSFLHGILIIPWLISCYFLNLDIHSFGQIRASIRFEILLHK